MWRASIPAHLPSHQVRAARRTWLSYTGAPAKDLRTAHAACCGARRRPGSALGDAAAEAVGDVGCGPEDSSASACGAGGGGPCGGAAAWTKKPEYGRVPAYLLDIKLELAQQRAAEQARAVQSGRVGIGTLCGAAEQAASGSACMACLRRACARGGCGRAATTPPGAPPLRGRGQRLAGLARGTAGRPRCTRARRAQAEREAARVPAGMRALPEAERLEMLEALGCARADLEAQVQARPDPIPSPNPRHVQARHRNWACPLRRAAWHGSRKLTFFFHIPFSLTRQADRPPVYPVPCLLQGGG
jgi:hypothetical protein